MSATEHKTKEQRVLLPEVVSHRIRKLGSTHSRKETTSPKIKRCYTKECDNPNIKYHEIESVKFSNRHIMGSRLQVFCSGCIKPCRVIVSVGKEPCNFMCHGGTTKDTTCPMHRHHKLCDREGCGISHTGNGKFCPRCECKVSGCKQLGPNYCDDHGCHNRNHLMRSGIASGSRCCDAHCGCGKRAMPGVHSCGCVAHACAQCGNELMEGKSGGGVKLERKTIVLSVPSDFGSNEEIKIINKMHFAELTTLQNTRMLGHGIEMQFCVDCFARYAPPAESVFGGLYN